MSQQNTQRLEVAVTQVRKHIPIDSILLKCLTVLTKTKVIQPR